MDRAMQATLAIVGSGSLTGVMLTIGIGLGGYWLNLPPQDVDQYLTRYFIYCLPCVIVSIGPALPCAIQCWRSAPESSQLLWRRSVLGLLLMLGVTTLIHLPLNVWVWFGPPIEDSTLFALLVGWLAAHSLRVMGALGATYYGLQAVFAEPITA